MRQAACRFSLPVEAQTRFLEFLVLELFLDRDCLESNRPVDARVFGQIYRTHRTAADTPFDDVTSEALRSYTGSHRICLFCRSVTVCSFHPLEHGFGSFGLGLFFEGQ